MFRLILLIQGFKIHPCDLACVMHAGSLWSSLFRVRCFQLAMLRSYHTGGALPNTAPPIQLQRHLAHTRRMTDRVHKYEGRQAGGEWQGCPITLSRGNHSAAVGESINRFKPEQISGVTHGASERYLIFSRGRVAKAASLTWHRRVSTPLLSSSVIIWSFNTESQLDMCDILLYGSILASITDVRLNAQCVRTITSCAFIHSKGGKPAVST